MPSVSHTEADYNQQAYQHNNTDWYKYNGLAGLQAATL